MSNIGSAPPQTTLTSTRQQQLPSTSEAGFVLASAAVMPLPGGVVTGEAINQAISGSTQAASAIRNALSAGGRFAPGALGAVAGAGVNLLVHMLFPPRLGNGDHFLAGHKFALQLAEEFPDQIGLVTKDGMVTGVINKLTGQEVMRNTPAGLNFSVPIPFDGRPSPLPPALRGNMDLAPPAPAATEPAPTTTPERDLGNYDPERNPAPVPRPGSRPLNVPITTAEPSTQTWPFGRNPSTPDPLLTIIDRDPPPPPPPQNPKPDSPPPMVPIDPRDLSWSPRPEFDAEAEGLHDVTPKAPEQGEPSRIAPSTPVEPGSPPDLQREARERARRELDELKKGIPLWSTDLEDRILERADEMFMSGDPMGAMELLKMMPTRIAVSNSTGPAYVEPTVPSTEVNRLRNTNPSDLAAAVNTLSESEIDSLHPKVEEVVREVLRRARLGPEGRDDPGIARAYDALAARGAPEQSAEDAARDARDLEALREQGANRPAAGASETGSPFEMPRSLFNPQPEAMAAAMEEWKTMVEEGIANGESLEEILARIGPAAQGLGRDIFAGTPIAGDYGAPRDSGARTTDLTHRLFESNLEPTLDFIQSDWDNVVNARTGGKPSFPASELRERLEAGDPEVFDLVHLSKIQTPRGEVISAMVTFSPDPREDSRGYRVVTAYPSNPETIAKIREGLSEAWKAATEIAPGDSAAIDAAAKFFHDYIHLYWHMHGNDEIGTSLIAGLLASKGFPIERLNPDASFSGGAFQSNRDDFAARFADGEYADFGVTSPTQGVQAAPGATRPADAPTRQEIDAVAEPYIASGTFTREELENALSLNEGRSLRWVIQQLALENQGYGSGELVRRAPTPPASAPAPATPGETVNLGQRPDLVDEAKALLDRAIADAEAPGAANDDRILDRAEVAEQIARHLQRDPDKVLAVLDGEGRVVGLGAYSISRNVFDPSEDGILYAEDLLSFAPSGSGVALSLLQDMYDRAPRGVMRLRSLNEGLDDHYRGLGGQPVTKPGASQHLFEWRERPARQR